MWKVLVIEDDPMLADIHNKYIQSQKDFTCVGVIHDASQGVETILSQKPDLILLDVYMPQMNGLDFLVQLRENQLDVDVILITAAKGTEQVEAAYRLGVIDYLVKPFEFSRLDKALNSFKVKKSKLSMGKTVNQSDLDALFRSSTTASEIILPKGLHERTLERVRKAISQQSTSFSIDDIVSAMDISKVTLRRYLEHLEKTGFIEIEMLYGSRGRPSYVYKRKIRF